MIAFNASGKRVFTARISPSTVVVATSPPSNAGATLSGWLPASDSTAGASSSSFGTPRPLMRKSSFAATKPPTTAVALLPNPQPGGIAMDIRIFTAGRSACLR